MEQRILLASHDQERHEDMGKIALGAKGLRANLDDFECCPVFQ